MKLYCASCDIDVDFEEPLPEFCRYCGKKYADPQEPKRESSASGMERGGEPEPQAPPPCVEPIPAPAVQPAEPQTLRSENRVVERHAVEGVKSLGLLITATWGDPMVHAIKPGANLVGRGQRCDLIADLDPQLEEVHCLVLFEEEVRVFDLNSSSGTYVDGRRVGRSPAVLSHGGTLRTGGTTWKLHVHRLVTE